MNNLVIKYYSLDDPLTDTPTKDIGYTGTVTYPIAVVRRVNNVPTIITDAVGTIPVVVIPKYGPYTQINKAAYDAIDVTGESQTLKNLRTRKEIFLERLALIALNPPADPDPEAKTLAQLQKELMDLADTGAPVSVGALPGGEGGGGELP